MTLLLWFALATAQEGADPAHTDPPVRYPTQGAPEQPRVQATPTQLVWSADPLGRGDDRNATKVEALLKAKMGPLIDCIDDQPEQTAILSTHLKLKLNGSVKWVRVKLSTGNDALDACAVGVIEQIQLPEPPRFADRMRVNVRWVEE